MQLVNKAHRASSVLPVATHARNMDHGACSCQSQSQNYQSIRVGQYDQVGTVSTALTMLYVTHHHTKPLSYNGTLL